MFFFVWGGGIEIWCRVPSHHLSRSSWWCGGDDVDRETVSNRLETHTCTRAKWNNMGPQCQPANWMEREWLESYINQEMRIVINILYVIVFPRLFLFLFFFFVLIIDRIFWLL